MSIAILGPTASGKSSLAVQVARRLRGTVVNGDPFQALAGLAIGTGQPTTQEQDGVPHLGYGVLPPSARLHPAGFGDLVRQWLGAVREPVLVTGSGLYLRGIWGQLTSLPEVPDALVQRVRAWGRQLPTPLLHRYLATVDPVRASGLHPNDGARIQRALALHLATGQRPSGLLTGVERLRESNRGRAAGVELRRHLVVTVAYEDILWDGPTAEVSLRSPRILQLRSGEMPMEESTPWEDLQRRALRSRLS